MSTCSSFWGSSSDGGPSPDADKVPCVIEDGESPVLCTSRQTLAVEVAVGRSFWI